MLAAANRATTVWAILLVMVGCGLNNLSLEFIIRFSPPPPNLDSVCVQVTISLFLSLTWGLVGA
jgi:hypothetical protein